MSLVGERAENRLPEYAQVLQRVISSKDHDSFRVRLNDRPCVIFSSETSNRWYLILSVDTDVLYAESDRQMAAMGAINLLMLVVVLTCAVVSARSRQCAAQSVSEGTAFLSGLATQLRQLSAHILRLNDQRLHEEGSDPAELAEHLNRAVDQLSALSENVRSYAALMALRQEPEQPRSVRHKKSSSAPSRTARSGILLTLTISLVIILFFCVRLSANWGVSQLNRDADHYENHLNQWIARQESVLSLFTGLLSAEPELMDDHDKAVRLLDDMAKPHPDIAACYLANPYAGCPTKRTARRIGSSARHLLSLINDILDMSRIESCRMELKEQDFVLRELVEQICVIIGGQCADKGLRFHSDTPGNLDAHFLGDDLKLKQSLINIRGRGHHRPALHHGRHRRGHGQGVPAQALRGLFPGGFHRHQPLRRQRPGHGYHQAVPGPDGRNHRNRERKGRGQYLRGHGPPEARSGGPGTVSG